MPTPTIPYSLRLPEDLHIQSSDAAHNDRISLNEWILQAVAEKLKLKREAKP